MLFDVLFMYLVCCFAIECVIVLFSQLFSNVLLFKTNVGASSAESPTLLPGCPV